MLQTIRKNPFLTKKNMEEGFLDLFQPLSSFFTKENLGHLKLGNHGTVYTEPRQEVEAFLRPLWGLGPYLVDNDTPFLEQYLDGIIAGTNPQSKDYWGEVEDFDQLIVEMASLSTLLLLNKEKTWNHLTKIEKENLHHWLIQVNERQIPRNNWHFFRVLVNLAMKFCDMPYSQEIINKDLTIIDSFYQKKGWYCDGVETQVDYYVSFAIHYYSLIYCHFMESEDPERVSVMKKRATEFAQTFKYWFAANGEAVPFGRSLTYRFAQVSFFSALVFANVEALPWGEIKGLISRHLHNWMEQEMFTTDGLLTVGYHYQNLVFAEGYNGPGSPYWAFKTFILLAVPKEHPYWQAKVEPLNLTRKMIALPESRNFYQFNEDTSHAQMFPAGQFINFQSHASAKYSKFVYSSHFGFSVPKSNYWYYEGAYDNCLALSEDNHYFRTKELDIFFEIQDDRIIHHWQPWSNVKIKSTILPLESCHIRIHEIETERELYGYEGAYSVPFEGKIPQTQKIKAVATTKIGTSLIEGIHGFLEADIVKTEPNTNLLYPTTILPHLKTRIGAGKHLLVSLVSGLLPEEQLEVPEIQVIENKVIVQQGNERKIVTLIN